MDDGGLSTREAGDVRLDGPTIPSDASERRAQTRGHGRDQTVRVMLSPGGPLASPLTRRQSQIACLARGDCQVNSLTVADSSSLVGMPGDARQPTVGSPSFSEAVVPELFVQDIDGSEYSWNDWLLHFVEVDALSSAQEELKIRMQDAVQSERYSEAARLKQELAKVESVDAVGKALSEMQEALQEERYGDAAEIRDAGLASMQGWWSGCSKDDPVGHLLHVKAEYGRWTGRVYRARDLEDMYLRRGSPRARTTPSLSPATKTVGSPVIEVFLRNTAGSSVSQGELVHQAVSLRIPTMDEVQDRRLASTLDDSASESDSEEKLYEPKPPASSSSVVRLSVSVGLDGTTSIKAQFPQDEESDEDNAPPSKRGDVLKSMVTKALGISADSVEIQMVDDSVTTETDVEELRTYRVESGVGRIEDGALTNQLKAWRPENGSDRDSSSASMPDEIIDITAAMSSLDWEDGAGADTPPFVRGSWAGAGSSSGSGAKYQLPELADDLAREGAFSDLTRVPAKLEMMGRDRFMFQVLEDPHEGPQSSGSSSYTSESGASSAGDADLAPGSGPSSLFDLKLREGGEGSSSFFSSSEEEGPDGGSESSFDVEIPVSRLLKQQSSSAASLSAAFDQLAEHVAQLQEAKVGRSVPRQALADAMREITTRLVSGKQVSNVTMLHIGLPDAPEVQPLAGPIPLPPIPQSPLPSPVAAKEDATKFMYNRIPMNKPHTDPFDGLYLGAFGPHGAEMLRLSRTTLDGEEAVSAEKITGDANVPMNQVSFRAKIGRKHKLDSRDVYPDQLGVVARYKGEGRVAQRGFRNARWVEGELLVFSSGGTPLTGNAELGFVWAVPGEKRFLILLNKVDLNDCEK
eukprot:gene8659-34110_t